MHKHGDLYRPNVGLVLFGPKNHVFVGERIDMPGAWQMPQGGMQNNETIEQAVYREMHEELGTNHADIIRVADQSICYELPKDLAKKLWSGQYIGQEQVWVAARFLGNDTDIDLDTHEEPEFLRWQWAALEDTPDLVVPFKRDVYRQVVSLFSYLV